jgi:hypothetical protein
MSKKLQITNTLNQLEAQIGNVCRASLEVADIETLRATSDELLRILEHKTKIDELLEAKLNEATKDLQPGEIFEAGLYKYEKIQKRSASKLDTDRLAEIVKDQDLFDTCFEVVKKPLTQAKLSKVFIENGIDMDVKQLYRSELKNEFTIKPKN